MLAKANGKKLAAPFGAPARERGGLPPVKKQNNPEGPLVFVSGTYEKVRTFFKGE